MSYAKRERFKVTPAVYIILKKEDKVLLLRRANTGYRDGYYTTPAGHIDADESAVDAAIREAKEEVDILLSKDQLQFAHVIYRKDPTDAFVFSDYFFVATDWKGEPKNMEPNKCDELKWYGLNAMPEMTIPHVRSVLEDWKDGISFSEEGF